MELVAVGTLHAWMHTRSRYACTRACVHVLGGRAVLFKWNGGKDLKLFDLYNMVMANMVLAYIAMADIVMAYTVLTYGVMAYIVMPYVLSYGLVRPIQLWSV